MVKVSFLIKNVAGGPILDGHIATKPPEGGPGPKVGDMAVTAKEFYKNMIRKCPASQTDMACLCTKNDPIIQARCRDVVDNINGLFEEKITTPWMECDEKGSLYDPGNASGRKKGRIVCSLAQKIEMGKGLKPTFIPHFKELPYGTALPEPSRIYDLCRRCAPKTADFLDTDTKKAPTTGRAQKITTDAPPQKYPPFHSNEEDMTSSSGVWNDINHGSKRTADCPIGRLQLRCACIDGIDKDGNSITTEAYAARCLEAPTDDPPWNGCLPYPSSYIKRPVNAPDAMIKGSPSDGAFRCAFPFGVQMNPSGYGSIIARNIDLPYSYWPKEHGPDTTIFDHCKPCLDAHGAGMKKRVLDAVVLAKNTKEIPPFSKNPLEDPEASPLTGGVGAAPQANAGGVGAAPQLNAGGVGAAPQPNAGGVGAAPGNGAGLATEMVNGAVGAPTMQE